jgi:hypothetical protein
MNIIDDSGSLCLTLVHVLYIGCPASLFSRMHDNVVLQIRAMMSLHLWLNLNYCMTFNKYSHLTLSKAFAISSLRNSIGVLE